MQKHGNKRIIAVLSDLFFTVKIKDAAKRAGLQVDFAQDEKEVLARTQPRPVLIILDLNLGSVQPLKLISRLKNDSELKQVSLIGYLSHVQGELKQKAHEAGCDIVLTKSAFSQNLPQILKRHAGTR